MIAFMNESGIIIVPRGTFRIRPVHDYDRWFVALEEEGYKAYELKEVDSRETAMKLINNIFMKIQGNRTCIDLRD